MENGKRICFVRNAKSGSHRAETIARIEQALGEAGHDVAIVCAFPDDDLPTSAALDEARIDTVLVFGGDGTINAAVAHWCGWGGQVLPLPGGTMNLLPVRLHGELDALEVVERFVRGELSPVRPQLIGCEGGRALAGLLVGPGTRWVVVREAMRDIDVLGVLSGTGEALDHTTEGPPIHFREPAIGREEGYPLVELEPTDGAVLAAGYYAETAGDFAQQGWALLRRSFRDGPHDDLGGHPKLVLASEDGEAIEVLIDGEPALLSSPATFALAECDVDLLAAAHGR